MPENEPIQPKNPNKSYLYESAKVMGVAFELGFLIALPVLALALGGKWLDKKHDTHYFVFIGIVTAMVISGAIIYRRFASMVETLREAARLKKENK